MTNEEFKKQIESIPNLELIEKAKLALYKLCKTSGKSFTMCIPPDIDDTDIILNELITRKINERIICAAVQIVETREIFYGHRHFNCIDAMKHALSLTMNRQEISKVDYDQGFITSENRFVDRIEAYKIAKEMKQLIVIENIAEYALLRSKYIY